MVVDHYPAFVDEAFIDPIRSVLIVDDDYPTFDELLNGAHASGKGWRTEPDRVMRVIDSLRSRKLLVDIHDGQNVSLADDVAGAEHLHQSDLLVLDYQLDKTKANDGTIAIKIIRKLMSNSHFNMVVVHTTERLDDVFETVLMSLLRHEPCEMDEGDLEAAETVISEADDVHPGFSRNLTESIARSQYLKTRQLEPREIVALVMKGEAPFAAFVQLCEVAKWNASVRKLVLRYQLSRFVGSIPEVPEAQTAKILEWGDGPIKWARSDSVFLAFSSKQMEESPLDELSKALNAWRPDPSRLYLARLRHEIDEHGTAGQGQVLGNKHALAGWYHGMLQADETEAKWQITQTILRHSESLVSSVTPNVAEFAERLAAAERGGDADGICKLHFAIDLKVESEKVLAGSQHNSVVSSKPPEGWHLTTGHVFSFADDVWICASPACDMVPSQHSAFRKKIYQERLPFAAIRLQPIVDVRKALEKASSTRMLFLELEGRIQAFSFNELGDDTSAPQWSVLFADDLGRFVKGSYEFGIVQVEAERDGLNAKRHGAKVISQLRYEYGLNLVQRLGTSMTRIGLDFTAYKAV